MNIHCQCALCRSVFLDDADDRLNVDRKVAECEQDKFEKCAHTDVHKSFSKSSLELYMDWIAATLQD